MTSSRFRISVFFLLTLICGACDKETDLPQQGCPDSIDFGYIELATEQENFLPYSTLPDIVFVDTSGNETKFKQLHSIDSLVTLNFNAECTDDSTKFVSVAMKYDYQLDVFGSPLGLKIGQYRYATIQFGLAYDLDPNDPLNPFRVVGINMVEDNVQYHTFEGCWLNWALDNRNVNNPLSGASAMEINGAQYENVYLSQFCATGHFKFVPGFGIVSFKYKGKDWYFSHFE